MFRILLVVAVLAGCAEEVYAPSESDGDVPKCVFFGPDGLAHAGYSPNGPESCRPLTREECESEYGLEWWLPSVATGTGSKGVCHSSFRSKRRAAFTRVDYSKHNKTMRVCAYPLPACGLARRSDMSTTTRQITPYLQEMYEIRQLANF